MGWDVGGWNCDRNRDSRDALAIIDEKRAPVGMPWRGNLRKTINQATTAQEFIAQLFELCQSDAWESDAKIVLAIDTPLGFSTEFKKLINGLEPVQGIETSNSNPYLFRTTERFLFNQGLKPLSAIKDMIGSQATKGIHVLAKFTPQTVSCGVWSDGGVLTSIEAYPSACKTSDVVAEHISAFRKRADGSSGLWGKFDHQDKIDALTCALVAWLFVNKRDSLIEPNPDIPMSEGWIWVPRDGLSAIKDEI